MSRPTLLIVVAAIAVVLVGVIVIAQDQGDTPVAGGDGTRVDAPATTVESDEGGTSVTAPGTSVETDDRGTRVQAPGVRHHRSEAGRGLSLRTVEGQTMRGPLPIARVSLRPRIIRLIARTL